MTPISVASTNLAMSMDIPVSMPVAIRSPLIPISFPSLGSGLREPGTSRWDELQFPGQTSEHPVPFGSVFLGSGDGNGNGSHNSGHGVLGGRTKSGPSMFNVAIKPKDPA